MKTLYAEDLRILERLIHYHRLDHVYTEMLIKIKGIQLKNPKADLSKQMDNLRIIEEAKSFIYVTILSMHYKEKALTDKYLDINHTNMVLTKEIEELTKKLKQIELEKEF